MHLLHLLWAIDFDALQAKLSSIASFVAFTVTGASVAANFLRDTERRAGKAVSFLALNWRTRHGVMKEKSK